MRTLSRTGPVLLLMGIGLAGCAPSGTDQRTPLGGRNDSNQGPIKLETEPGTLAAGTAAPDIEGEDSDGKKFKLSDYRGKVVLLDFWFSS
jgi:cytochrome oxidase Cu insertion factor (SCO1/SenC/PrrC family)